jgi:hypothetical protein
MVAIVREGTFVGYKSSLREHQTGDGDDADHELCRHLAE